jgi:hypothetical protein
VHLEEERPRWRQEHQRLPMKRYQKILSKSADACEHAERTGAKEDAADNNISPQDTKVLPKRERLDVCFFIRHLGFLGRRSSLLFVLLGC